MILGSATAGAVILLPTVTRQLGEAVSQAPVSAESGRVPILAFFLLKDADTSRRSAVSALPHSVRRRGQDLFVVASVTYRHWLKWHGADTAVASD